MIDFLFTTIEQKPIEFLLVVLLATAGVRLVFAVLDRIFPSK